MEIKSKNGGVLFSAPEAKSIKEAIEMAVKRKVSLRDADLEDADLRWADLAKADLRGADLRWADLRCAGLAEADLRGADLRWADLAKANLRWADLRGANLEKADLRGAGLRGADLKGADLGYETPKDFALNVAKAAVAEGAIEMKDWHSPCGTKHCIAGWAETLHPQAEDMKDRGLSTEIIGHITLPVKFRDLFFADNEEALKFLNSFVNEYK